ncbi:chitinase [Arthrobacter sp. efr-133-TYG-118]|uniref:chitinase n=1 Tax=Arthrobacter sp. efr-133-TYG-118 TaxID=3040279 RepID=UPI002550AF1A|nr:chitinase [Arthrobacter sp. efr-133-TYG-118]
MSRKQGSGTSVSAEGGGARNVRGRSAQANGPRRRLSAFARACIAAALVVVGIGGFLVWRLTTDANGSLEPPWFSGYVDVTVVPQYSFETPTGEGTKNVTLAFVVAMTGQACTPSWGSVYSLDAAKTSLKLEERIAKLRSNGGAFAVSFGGSLNSELANSCQNAADLERAYRAVLERYNPETIDFDIEGDNLADSAAWQRRAAAIAALQKERSKEGHPLSIWLTLPVTPQGLTDAGTSAVDQMLAAGVQLSGVNIMTMNYGSSRSESQSMLDAGISAAESTHDQLSIIYQRAGTALNSEQIWRKMGLTPMIGRNDLPGEVFDLDAARGLNSFAISKVVQRVSMWSLNRDMSCPQDTPEDPASHVCSGIDQGTQRFSDLLSAGFHAKLP